MGSDLKGGSAVWLKPGSGLRVFRPGLNPITSLVTETAVTEGLKQGVPGKLFFGWATMKELVGEVGSLCMLGTAEVQSSQAGLFQVS